MFGKRGKSDPQPCDNIQLYCNCTSVHYIESTFDRLLRPDNGQSCCFHQHLSILGLKRKSNKTIVNMNEILGIIFVCYRSYSPVLHIRWRHPNNRMVNIANIARLSLLAQHFTISEPAEYCQDYLLYRVDTFLLTCLCNFMAMLSKAKQGDLSPCSK